MTKAKGKGGTGRGTGKKGWNRWQAGERRARNAPKPYKSKGTGGKDGGTSSSSKNAEGKNNVKE